MAKLTTPNYKLEEHVNDWVKSQFKKLGLKNQEDYYTESTMPEYLIESLRGRAKTRNKTNFGKPDFSIDKYKFKDSHIPIIIENKLGTKKLISETKDGVKFDEKSVNGYAVNGALYYATGMVETKKYSEVIAIGIAGDSEDTIAIKVYYVYGGDEHSYKYIESTKTLDFLENEHSFESF